MNENPKTFVSSVKSFSLIHQVQSNLHMQEVGFARLSLIFTILHASYLQIKDYICNLLIAFLLALSVMLLSGYV